MPKLLARMNIRDVNLDQTGGELDARITQYDRGMSQSAGVENYRFAGIRRVVNPAEQVAFVIALTNNHLDAQFLTGRDTQFDQIVVRGRAVHLRLTLTEAAEIRSVDDVDFHRRTVPPDALGGRAIAEYAATSSDGSGPSSLPGLAKPSRTTNRSSPARFFLSVCIPASN